MENADLFLESGPENAKRTVRCRVDEGLTAAPRGGQVGMAEWWDHKDKYLAKEL